MKQSRELKQFVESIRDREHVVAAYVFGSSVTGMKSPISDVDVCIITDTQLSLKKRASIASEAGDTLDVSFFWALPLTMRKRVVSEGECLYVRDQLTLDRIERQTLLAFFDFQPTFKRAVSEVMG